MAMARRLGLALLLTAAVASAGCRGYTASGLFRPDIKTVYLAEFDNATFRRGLEVPLKRAVEQEIIRSTPLTFALRDEADSILSGELLQVTLRARVETVEDETLLTHVNAKVRFRWRDRRAGTDIVPEQVIVESVRIAPALEDTLTDYLFQQVAKRIVERMQEPW